MGDSIDKGYLYICEVFSSEVVQRYLEGSPVRTSVSLYILYIAPVVSFGRVMAVTVGGAFGRTSVILGLWCLGAVSASASADAETGHKCHRGQARRARQVADG